MQIHSFHLTMTSLAAVAITLTACSSGAQSTAAATSEAEIGEIASKCADDYDGDLKSLPKNYPTPEPEDLTIGFLQPLAANEAVNYLQKFVEAAVTDLGGTTVAYDAAGQPDKQVTQMEQLLNQDVDAIVVFPLDASALNPMVARAKKEGVPVVGVEVNPNSTEDIGDFTTQIFQGRDEHAYVHACVMAGLHPGAEVATIGFAVPVPSIRAYVDRATFWAEEFGLEIVDSVDNPSDDVAGGEQVTSGLLAKHPDLKGILAYNDPTAIGARTAARGQSRDIAVFGVNGGSDAFAAIEAGKQDLTLQFPEEEWGRELVAAAYVAVQDPDEELPRTTYPGSVQVLTKDNIEQAETWKEQLENR